MLAVLLAAMFFQAFEIPGWISWLLLGIVIGNLFFCPLPCTAGSSGRCEEALS